MNNIQAKPINECEGLTKAQRKVLEETSRNIVITGGFATGKTFAMCRKIASVCYSQPETMAVIAVPARYQASRILYSVLRDAVHIYDDAIKIERDGNTIVFDNGSQIAVTNDYKKLFYVNVDTIGIKYANEFECCALLGLINRTHCSSLPITHAIVVDNKLTRETASHLDGFSSHYFESMADWKTESEKVNKHE